MSNFLGPPKHFPNLLKAAIGVTTGAGL